MGRDTMRTNYAVNKVEHALERNEVRLEDKKNTVGESQWSDGSKESNSVKMGRRRRSKRKKVHIEKGAWGDITEVRNIPGKDARNKVKVGTTVARSAPSGGGSHCRKLAWREGQTNGGHARGIGTRKVRNKKEDNGEVYRRNKT